jgi:hypothetical protein
MLVRSFLREAASVGLAYLGDAVPSTTALELQPDEVRSRALVLERAEAEQLIDFARNASFRRALLVRADAAKAASFSAPRELDRTALGSLCVASRLRPKEGGTPQGALETFEEGEQAVQVSGAEVRRALRALAEAAPAPLAFAELARLARKAGAGGEAGDGKVLDSFALDLASELFDLGLATGAIDWLALSAPPSFVRHPGEHPIACPVARWHAAHGGVVTNRLHQEVLLPDSIVRWVLARLDGTRTRATLVHEARSIGGAERATADQLRQLIDASIERLAACALIVA